MIHAKLLNHVMTTDRLTRLKERKEMLKVNAKARRANREALVDVNQQIIETEYRLKQIEEGEV